MHFQTKFRDLVFSALMQTQTPLNSLLMRQRALNDAESPSVFGLPEAFAKYYREKNLSKNKLERNFPRYKIDTYKVLFCNIYLSTQMGWALCQIWLVSR